MRHVIEFKNKSGIGIPKVAQNYVDQLMQKLKDHDLITYEHCLRVSQMSMDLSQNMGLNILEQTISLYAGLLHDVGKVHVPREIISKPSRLSEAEFKIMKQHAQFGVDLIAPLVRFPFFKKVSDAVLYHHERIDGKGYMEIKKEQIPIVSKIIHVVDTVDAMSADRAYRKGLPMVTVIEELIRCSGTQFDTRIVEIYLDSQQNQLKKAA